MAKASQFKVGQVVQFIGESRGGFEHGNDYVVCDHTLACGSTPALVSIERPLENGHHDELVVHPDEII